MVWTNPADDPATDQSQVRVMIGDTNPADPQLQDEWLAPLLDAQPNLALVAYQACVRLVGKYARQAAGSVGPLRESSQERITNYTNLAVLYYRIGNGLPPDKDIPFTVVPAAADALGAAPTFASVRPFFTRCWPR